MGVMCNATLVAMRVAVTAAHCVDDFLPAQDLRMGFGDVGSQPTIRVTCVIVHPRFVPGNAGVWHDVAVLILELDAPITPALLGSTAVGEALRVVGTGVRSTRPLAPSGAMSIYARARSCPCCPSNAPRCAQSA